MTDNNILIVVMILYMSIILFWGFYQGRKVKSSGDFSIAGRKLPGAVAAFSERATGESSWALLGLPGAAFATGLTEIWTAAGCVAGILFAWTVIGPVLRNEAEKYDVETFTDYLAKRHGEVGKAIRIAGSLTIVFFFFFYVGAQFLGGGKTLHNLFDIDQNLGMIIIVLLVVPYTVYGGFRSVTYTDVIQGVVMLVTLIITPIVGIIHISGMPETAVFANSISEALTKAGPAYSTMTGSAILQEGSSVHTFLAGILPDTGNLISGIGTGLILAGSFSWFFGYLGGQPQLTMRFMAISDDKQAKIARNIGVLWTITAYIGALAVGWIGIAMFGPDGLADRETVMPEVLTALFHPVIAGILITGVLAAVISTANSLLILSATELSENLPAFRKKSGSQKSSLLRSRAVTALLSLVALLLAWLSPSDLIYKIVGYVWAGIGSTFSVVILLTLFWKRFSGAAALATIIVGLVFTIVWIGSGADEIISAILMTFVVAGLTAIITSYLKPNSGKQSPA